MLVRILKVTNEKSRIRIRYSEIRIRTKMSQNRNTDCVLFAFLLLFVQRAGEGGEKAGDGD